ncbi:type IV pilin-like G/H family protein [Gloeothece verrucosa]|uniref:Pilin polypeptide n=1 Tax=Gloeothece verrucosa (strain PCC 7822) TaxID=497965 RepID=E0U7S0_GLOV7|nr:type IV pilin-like G/H family protein [Gloeothece verrucosa]ADN14882.1 pilin polypeptide [Gloeothece verrucosa PCC 7822]
MNSQFKIKFLNHLNKKNNKGFTLIELLVVVIIIGVLAAIALPNLLGQVAKGRQAEAKNNLGAINRAQQAYRLEEATFGALSNLPLKVTGQYYDFSDGATAASATGANQKASAKTAYDNDILDYKSAVGQMSDGTFSAVICEQTTNPSATTPGDATAGTAAAQAACPTNTKAIK